MLFQDVKVASYASPRGVVLAEAATGFSGRIWISSEEKPGEFVEYYQRGNSSGLGSYVFVELIGFDKNGAEIRKDLYFHDGICTVIQVLPELTIAYTRLINYVRTEVDLSNTSIVLAEGVMSSVGIYRLPDNRFISIRADKQKMRYSNEFIDFRIGLPGEMERVRVIEAKFNSSFTEIIGIVTTVGTFHLQTAYQDATWFDGESYLGISLLEMDEILNSVLWASVR